MTSRRFRVRCPSWRCRDPSLFLTLLLPAFSVAVIGLVQGAGVSQGTPNPDGRYPNVSRDFLGQGVANIATSLVGGIPAGGSVSGTALVMSAGGKSRWANIFVGLFVAAIVLLAAPLVELVPMPALAALLIVAGFQGLRIPQALIAWKTGRISRVVMARDLRRHAGRSAAVRGAVRHGAEHRAARLPPIEQGRRHAVGAAAGRLSARTAAARRLPSHQLTLLHVYGSLFFAAAKSMEEMLPEVGNTTHAVVAINLRGKSEIGSTFVTVLQRYSEALQRAQSRLMLVGVDPVVRDQLAKTGCSR